MKLWLTSIALLNVALPACDALTVQVPVAARLTILPLTVHTAGVAEENATGRPDVAVALTANGGLPRERFGSAAKLMNWFGLMKIV